MPLTLFFLFSFKKEPSKVRFYSCLLLELVSQRFCVVTVHIFHFAENNDDIERMARRRSRLLEPHPDVVNSPAHDAARRSVASQVMPRTQIGEHYGNCIRLAAENKITYKNAFDLHLIDYMGEMIKKEDFTSFRVSLNIRYFDGYNSASPW